MSGADRRPTSGIDVRELEAFLVLAEELHFGRAAARLHLSQSRVSQLLRALEERIGGPLLDRTSRQAGLTPLGASFLADLRPAYEALRGAVDRAHSAARGARAVLRLGFQGSVDGQLAAALRRLETHAAPLAVDLVEIPLADPFGALRRRELDAAVVMLPVEEDDLQLGPVFSRQPQTLVVAAGDPLARRPSVAAEELANRPLIGLAPTAPRYWRRVQAPDRTPRGSAIPAGPAVTTLQEGLSLAAAGRGALLLCRATADQHAGRASLAFVPVNGLPESALGLVWRRGDDRAPVRALAEAIATARWG